MLHDIAVIADALGKTPIEALAMLVSLGVLGLAGFAIYAVWSIARQKGRRS
jgi:hypothetical protein